MPSVFSKPKQQPQIHTISRPVLCEPPTIDDFQSHTPFPRVPQNPPPPPPPPIPHFTPRTNSTHRDTTASQIINLYGRPASKPNRDHSRFHEHINSPPRSAYSASQCDDDESMVASSPASSFSFSSREKKHEDRFVAPATRTPYKPDMPSPSSRRSPGGTVHPSGPFIPTISHSRNQHHHQPQRPLPSTPRTDALARGLSRRFAPAPRGSTVASITNQTRPALAASSQPLGAMTRLNTRRQGYWLGLGTMRVDPKELKKREKEEKEGRRREEKMVRMIEKEKTEGLVASR